MDVLGAREVLAVRTPMVMRQRPLKDGTEDRGAHASPIEFLTALDNERMSETLGQWRDFRPLTKEATVHVGQLLQPRLGVLIAVLILGVEPDEQVLEAAPEIACREVGDVVAEGVGGYEPESSQNMRNMRRVMSTESAW